MHTQASFQINQIQIDSSETDLYAAHVYIKIKNILNRGMQSMRINLTKFMSYVCFE